jgi:hypothetical protein
MNGCGDCNNLLRHKESTLDELNSASGFIRFGRVNVEMVMGAWDTLYYNSFRQLA